MMKKKIEILKFKMKFLKQTLELKSLILLLKRIHKMLPTFTKENELIFMPKMILKRKLRILTLIIKTKKEI